MKPLKKHRFSLLYGFGLVIFSAFVLLDAFVIPHAEREVPSQEESGQSAQLQAALDVPSPSGMEGELSFTPLPEASPAAVMEPVITKNSYTDSNIEISITSSRQYDTEIYIADIRIKDITYLKSAFAEATYGRNIRARTSAIAESVDAILAINGDYYGFRSRGFVLRNGVAYRDSSYGNQALCILLDGSFLVVEEDDTALEDLAQQGAWQVFSFGPGLVADGAYAVDVSSQVDREMASNPRTAIGQIEPLHYIFVVSDGRTEQSDGLTLYELATVMLEYGCVDAYNLDGGGSSTMWFNGAVVNNPTGGSGSSERRVSDIVYIGY